MKPVKFVVPTQRDLIPYFGRLLSDHIRFHGINLVETISCSQCYSPNSIYIFLNPTTADCEDYICSLSHLNNVKIIIYGAIRDSLFTFLDSRKLNGMNFHLESRNTLDDHIGDYIFATDYCHTIFPNYPLTHRRASSNYDFDSEWNNRRHANFLYKDTALMPPHSHEYMDSLILGIATPDLDVKNLVNYFQFTDSSLLLINRLSGLSDLPETYILEEYLSNYSFGSFTSYPVVPILSESSSANGDKLISMRFDCDEDIDSAYPVFNVYSSLKIPVSLAITSYLLEDTKNKPTLPFRVIDTGGSLLSHSHSHRPAWGGSYEESILELTRSRELIYENYGYIVEYAVSPFHDMPNFIVPALEKCQYKGVVGGISSKYVNYLSLTAGQISYKSKIAFSNQQCMLHGKTHLLKNGSWEKSLSYFLDYSILIGKSAGYLDHPISNRYSYDWDNTNNQTELHSKVIEFLLARDVKFISQSDLFTRIIAKQNVNLRLTNNSDIVVKRGESHNFPLYLKYGGNEYELNQGKSYVFSLLDNRVSFFEDDS